MTHADELTEGELFRKMVTISIVLHVSFFIFFFLKSFLIPSKAINLESAVRVDMVGLPDKITELPKKEDKPIAPKPAEVTPPPSAKVEKADKPKDDAINLKKKSAMDRIKEFEKEERRKKTLQSIQDEINKQEASERAEKARKIMVKGNAINPGTALHGLTKAEFNEYVAELHAHLLDHWNLPEWLKDASLKTTVIVQIDAQGKLIKRRIEKSSGDERFDDYALKAVDEASPFPKPPEKFVDIMKTNGFKCGFPE